MIGILFGAWVFCMVSFCAVGVGCRIACRGRRIQGRACICGRHERTPRPLKAQAAARPLPIDGRPSRLRAAEKRVRALQQRYIDGRLSMEQYESELDRLVGLA
ncbi:MAG: hypothetical protein M8866_10630 [marine benthic group bacterium]|nr:hypothetical protein [Candidatus Benthicola marisminoris]